jgi:hypothetical protein
MGKKKLPKGSEISFSETAEGQSVDLFAERWYSLPFGKKIGLIDHEKLWWELHGASEQGYIYVNWMSAARTFYNNKPWIYKATTSYNQLSNGQSTATLKASELLGRSIQVATTSGSEESFFPQHLRSKHYHNGGGNERPAE